jgi:hypothetical protein
MLTVLTRVSRYYDTAMTVLESMIASMTNVEPLWPHIADTIKDSADFDWIRLTCYFHIQRTEGCIKNVPFLEV